MRGINGLPVGGGEVGMLGHSRHPFGPNVGDNQQPVFRGERGVDHGTQPRQERSWLGQAPGSFFAEHGGRCSDQLPHFAWSGQAHCEQLSAYVHSVWAGQPGGVSRRVRRAGEGLPQVIGHFGVPTARLLLIIVRGINGFGRSVVVNEEGGHGKRRAIWACFDAGPVRFARQDGFQPGLCFQ